MEQDITASSKRPRHRDQQLRRKATMGICCAALIAAAGWGPPAAAARVSSAPALSWPVRSCSSLTGIHLANGSVTSATSLAQTTTTRSYCKVSATITNAPAHDAVHVGVYLPTASWNGGFIGTGGGGYVAGVPTTPCMFVPQVVADPCAINANYATANTDAGHTNPRAIGDDHDGSWALNADTSLNWQRIDDFGYLGIHEMTTTAKAVITAFYGRAPQHAFFTGGSNGGHQAIMEAQRYPRDYNGIAAAAPAINFTTFVPAWMWGELLMNWSHDFIPQTKFTTVNNAAIAACDARDRVTDGIISDWQHCHYDARAMIGTRTPAGPITPTDATIIDKIWQGPRGPQGEFLWYGYQPGADFSTIADTTTHSATNHSPTNHGPTNHGPTTSPSAPQIPTQWYQYWLTQNPRFDWRSLSYPQFVALLRQSVSEFGYAIATDDPNLTAFRDAGGKLVFWHGTYDPKIPTMGSVDYWNRLTRTMGGARQTEKFARFFVAPGAGHVDSAAGPAPKDALGSIPEDGTALGAVVNWVEHNQAPTELLGVTNPHGGLFNTDGTIDMTRPICLYPLVARYTGHGNTNEANNFTCSNHF